ncbi:CHRD domain-containing protein [Microbulbifer sp. ANSA003]|uniref:CHRD domain-containing protein n=1 Tax=Microbulbifer sp. ANSA003 TaxID=3243360 RepID=UPI0040431BF2
MKLSSLPRATFLMLAVFLLAYSAFTVSDSHNKKEKDPSAAKHGASGEKAWSKAGNDKMFTIFKSDLTTANENMLGKKVNPQTPKNADGFFIGAYDKQSHMLHFMVGYSDLSKGGVAMSHFHMQCAGDGKEPPICKPGKPSGPIIQTICGMPNHPGMVPDWPETKTDKGKHGLAKKCAEGTSGYIMGKWMVEEPYRKALMDGKVFVNLHTQLDPKGEVSGLLTMDK